MVIALRLHTLKLLIRCLSCYRTQFVNCASAALRLSSGTPDIADSCLLTVFKSRYRIFLFRQTFTDLLPVSLDNCSCPLVSLKSFDLLLIGSIIIGSAWCCADQAGCTTLWSRWEIHKLESLWQLII